jgi:hypothetical protein
VSDLPAFRELFRLSRNFSCPFEFCVHGVKALECRREKLLIAQVRFGPTFEDLINPELSTRRNLSSRKSASRMSSAKWEQSSVALAKQSRETKQWEPFP